MKGHILIMILAWALLLPPYGEKDPETGIRFTVTNAPLEAWSIDRYFDAATECNRYRENQANSFLMSGSTEYEKGSVLGPAYASVYFKFQDGRCLPVEYLIQQGIPIR